MSTYTSGRPVLHDLNHRTALSPHPDRDFALGVRTGWGAVARLLERPRSAAAQVDFDTAVHAARLHASEMYSLGFLHGAEVARELLTHVATEAELLADALLGESAGPGRDGAL